MNTLSRKAAVAITVLGAVALAAFFVYVAANCDGPPVHPMFMSSTWSCK